VPPRYTQQFKDEAVRMVLDGPRPITHVARELGIHDTTLGNWVSQYRRSMAGPGSKPRDREAPTERERQLERENRKLREENAFLVKAASFFARDHR
jgi:transposase